MNMDEFDVASSVKVWGETTKHKVLLLMFMSFCHCSRVKIIQIICYKHHS